MEVFSQWMLRMGWAVGGSCFMRCISRMMKPSSWWGYRPGTPHMYTLKEFMPWLEYRGSSSICCCSRREKWGIMSTRDSWDTSRRRRSITGR